MAASQESRLEQAAGDLLHRRRVADTILNDCDSYEHCADEGMMWHYGPITVVYAKRGGVVYLACTDPEGDVYEVGIPSEMDDPERIEAVQRELDHVALHWTDDL